MRTLRLVDENEAKIPNELAFTCPFIGLSVILRLIIKSKYYLLSCTIITSGITLIMYSYILIYFKIIFIEKYIFL